MRQRRMIGCPGQHCGDARMDVGTGNCGRAWHGGSPAPASSAGDGCLCGAGKKFEPGLRTRLTPENRFTAGNGTGCRDNCPYRGNPRSTLSKWRRTLALFAGGGHCLGLPTRRARAGTCVDQDLQSGPTGQGLPVPVDSSRLCLPSHSGRVRRWAAVCSTSAGVSRAI